MSDPDRASVASYFQLRKCPFDAPCRVLVVDNDTLSWDTLATALDAIERLVPPRDASVPCNSERSPRV